MEKSIHRKADIVFTRGTVITMEDPVAARAMDVAVADGRILALGDRGSLRHLEGPETRVIDLENRTLMPGLIDSHNHMVRFGENLQMLDLSPSKAGSLEEMIEKLESYAAGLPPGDWVRAWGYDDTCLKEKRHPTRDVLDKACPDRPVSIMRTCMHVMAVNSVALKMAGITADTEEPDGGEIVRGENGQPIGILYELGAMNLINRLIPDASAEQCADYLKAASEVYASQGLTTVFEAGAGWSGNPNEAAGFQRAFDSGYLKTRIAMGLMEDTYRLFPQIGGTGLHSGFGNDRLWIGAAKFVADGGIGPMTAALTRPYENTDYLGVLCEDAVSLTDRMQEAHDAGFQISVHAIGDRTIDMVLTAYETILARSPRAHRHRIEHAAVCRPDFLPRIKKLGLVLAVQPAFLYYLADSWLHNLGEERIRYTIPLKSMLESGIIVAGSSDRPVANGNPWMGIWGAVNRTSAAGKKMSPQECIHVTEALKLYTVNGAYVNAVENRLGSITPGKQADLVVLDANPLEIDPVELKDIRVLHTFVHGEEVFQAH